MTSKKYFGECTFTYQIEDNVKNGVRPELPVVDGVVGGYVEVLKECWSQVLIFFVLAFFLFLFFCFFVFVFVLFLFLFLFGYLFSWIFTHLCSSRTLGTAPLLLKFVKGWKRQERKKGND